MSTLTAIWVEVALYVPTRHGAILIDAPPGAAEALIARSLLSSVHTVVISSDRVQAVAGLLSLFGACAARGLPSPRVIHLGQDRSTPLIVSAWNQGWQPQPQTTTDAVMAGMPIDIDDAQLCLHELPVGRARGRVVVPASGAAVQVHQAEGTLVWIPTCRPTTRIRRLCGGADLAVIEVGVVDWPRTDHPHRLTVSDALESSQSAGQIWLTGDDRRKLPPLSVE